MDFRTAMRQGAAMLVVCNGMPRSASTWSYNVVCAVLREADPAAPLHAGYSEDPAAFLAAAPPGTRHAVLKCHALPDLLRTLAGTGAARIVFTTRDIADAVASFMAMFGADFAHALAVMDGALHHLSLHRSQAHALILDYADILADPAGAVARLAAHLRLSLADTQLAGIAEEMSLPRMRERIPSADQAPHLMRHGAALYDPRTLLNIGHIKDGSPGGGKRALLPGQLAAVAELLQRHGLPMPWPG